MQGPETSFVASFIHAKAANGRLRTVGARKPVKSSMRTAVRKISVLVGWPEASLESALTGLRYTSSLACAHLDVVM